MTLRAAPRSRSPPLHTGTQPQPIASAQMPAHRNGNRCSVQKGTGRPHSVCCSFSCTDRTGWVWASHTAALFPGSPAKNSARWLPARRSPHCCGNLSPDRTALRQVSSGVPTARQAITQTAGRRLATTCSASRPLAGRRQDAQQTNESNRPTSIILPTHLSSPGALGALIYPPRLPCPVGINPTLQK